MDKKSDIELDGMGIMEDRVKILEDHLKHIENPDYQWMFL